MASLTPVQSRSVQLRAAAAQDGPLLQELYAVSRRDELAALGWSGDQQDDFLAMQFRLREAGYQAKHPQALDQIILLGDVAIGRLLVQQTPPAIHLIDIALLPEARGQGVGTMLISDLMSQAQAARGVLSLYVEAGNPAGRLYRRLGFVEVARAHPYVRLQWSAAAEETSIVS